MLPIRHLVPALAMILALGPWLSAGDVDQATEALAQFRKAWKPLPAGQYMRPLDDQGWKARVGSLKALARVGPKASDVLKEAIASDDSEAKVFAAQAMSLLPAAASKTSLTNALKDPHPAVRLYALDALSMFGKVPREEPYLTLQAKDPNRDVRSHAKFALDRDDKPHPESIKKVLQDYDLKLLGTAKIGEKAPDFTLADVAGKPVKLSQFRGKPVVLVFIYGDT